MGGYQASFQFNLTDILHCQGTHIANVIGYTREQGHTTVDPSYDAEEWWVQEVIKHRGKTKRNEECTPGYYNFEGEFQRRQDGNYNGGARQYYEHMDDVQTNMEKYFVFN
ncbi:MAG: hypothetical protein AAF512_18365, partial [Pseudomonadota bacterium]